MRHKVNFFTDEIDGNELSREQSGRIRNIFDDLKDDKNLLNFRYIIDLLGHYAPDAVLKRLFSSHNQTPSDVTLDIFLRLLRFLLNGTKQDRMRALCCYYTCGHSYVSVDALKDIIEEEEWSMDKLGSLIKKNELSYDRLSEYFLQSQEATNVSKWLLGSRLNLASNALNRPSKSLIMSTSTGIDEEILRAEYLEFKRIAACDEYLINQSSFHASLNDIFPDAFITGLFKFFDVNNDGYVDVMEFFNGLAFLPHANKVDSARRIFQMFSSQTEAGAIFDSDAFDNILRYFIPQRVLVEPSCRISDIGECITLSDFTSWASNNPAFLHFIEFLKSVMHIVFGLPLPSLESETSKVIMLWLRYLIVQLAKQGSQWFIISSQYWSSLYKQGLILGLLPSPHHGKNTVNHPRSLYEKLFTDASDSVGQMLLNRNSLQDRVRSKSCAEGNRFEPSEKLKSYQRPVRRISKQKYLHRETKAERERGRSTKSVSHSTVSPLEGDVTFNNNNAQSREEMQPGSMEAIVQEPSIAVDRRLVERLQCWSGLKSNISGISDNGQLMPSYLILCAPGDGVPMEETMEMYPLKIGVHWVAGCKPKIAPTTRVNTDTGVPKNPHFDVPPISTGAKEVASTSGKRRFVKKRSTSILENSGPIPVRQERKRSRTLGSNILTRSISVPGKNWSNSNLDCIYVLPEKLSEQSLRFIFSRCHSLAEVCEVVGKAFTDYRDRELTPDIYRVWFVKAPESAGTLRQKPQLNQITKISSPNCDESSSDDEANDSRSGNNPLAKRICLAPVNVKTIGDKQLGRYLADQDPFTQHYMKLLDPNEECTRSFEFVIESVHQANYWPLGQRPSEAGPFVGLKNMGNTCYFNSVIQCLRMTPLLERRIRSCASPQTKLANEYIKLIDQMERERSANPRILWHAFVQRVPAFNSTLQQDAHEFLIILLDLLNEELKHKFTSSKDGTLRPRDSRKKSTITNTYCVAAEKWSTFCAENDSPITSIFYGLCESRCQFEECSHKTSSFDFFASLTLPLPVDEVNSITLTVVSSYTSVPEKYRLESDSFITVDFIRQQVSSAYNCLPSQIFLGMYHNETLTPLPHPSTESGKVNSKFNYWAFILPPRRSGSLSDKEMVVIVQNRILVPLHAPLLEETADQRELHGSPIVLQIPPSTTNKELYDVIESCLSRYHKSSGYKSGSRRSNYKASDRMGSTPTISEMADGKYFFTLKQAEKHFWKCSKCRWPKMCRGCPIPCTSDKVNLRPSGNGCIYIAADWSLDEFVNEFQPNHEGEQKMAGQVGSSNSDAVDAIQLSSLLQKFFQEELVNKSDGILCNYCHRRKSFTMSTMLCKLPEVLLISLKRFHATNHGWRKSSNLVHFPLTSLDLRTHLSREAECENTVYDLYAVVNHMGRLDGGHYYAYIRVKDGSWFRVNDMQYSEVRKESVITPDAYILFYRRRQTH